MASSNGNGATLTWVMGLLAAIVVGLSAWTLNATSSASVEIATVKARQESHGDIHLLLKERLVRIEDKGDKILEILRTPRR